MGTVSLATAMQEVQCLATFLSVSCDNVKIQEQTKVPCVEGDNGNVAVGLASVSKYLTRKCKRKDLLGQTPEGEAFVNQWVEYRVTQLARLYESKESQLSVLKELNGHMANRVFFVGQNLSLADIVMYFGLYNTFREMSFLEKQQYSHLSRWFRHIQEIVNVRSMPLVQLSFQKTPIYTSLTTH